MIIAISGKIGSGKDTIAKIIRFLATGGKVEDMEWSKETLDELDDPDSWNPMYFNLRENPKTWQVKKFAGKLKQVVSLYTGIPVEDLEKEEVKNSYLPEEWNRWRVEIPNVNLGDLVLISNLFVSFEEAYKYVEDKGYNLTKYRIYEESITVRKLLQTLGTECFRDKIHPNAHVIGLFVDYKIEGDLEQRKIDFYKSKGVDDYHWLKRNDNSYYQDLKVEFFEELNKELPNWLISDLRFPNEGDGSLDRKALLLRVERSIIGDQDNTEDFINKTGVFHPSETALDDYKKFHYILDNNGTIEELVEKVRQILIEEKIL